MKPLPQPLGLAGGALAGFVVGGPIGAVVGGGAAWLLYRVLGVGGSAFANTLAAEAQAMIGAGADSDAVTAVVGMPPATRPNWCALFVEGLVHRTAKKLGVPSPIPGSAGALLTMEEFQKADPKVAGWIDIGRIRSGAESIRAGDVPIYRRDPPPGQEWHGEGHIGIVPPDGAETKDGKYLRVDGNNGPVIGKHEADVKASNFLGVGRFF